VPIYEYKCRSCGIVQEFLEARPDLPARLRGKLLQASDGLERSARIVFRTPT